MGYIYGKCYRVGIGSVDSKIEVEEPAGHKGKWLTPAGQTRKAKFRIMRKGRIVKNT